MEDNKQLIAEILAGERSLLEYLEDDAEWVIPGINTYRGKEEVINRLVPLFFERIISKGEKTVTNIVAEGEYVVAESYATGRETVDGKAYNNTYCVVYRLVNGRIRRITEYCDTALVREVFGDAIGK